MLLCNYICIFVLLHMYNYKNTRIVTDYNFINMIFDNGL